LEYHKFNKSSISYSVSFCHYDLDT
jgi:hypothetical protein